MCCTGNNGICSDPVNEKGTTPCLSFVGKKIFDEELFAVALSRCKRHTLSRNREDSEIIV
jgi:hypothetical protein